MPFSDTITKELKKSLANERFEDKYVDVKNTVNLEVIVQVNTEVLHITYVI